ncbi:helicase associated domain-containing protein [Microscilla marina]|uniref:Helicase, putative n=1 Tax=Microscilla marina ATCC 23134 TaxID=313606 RepID=A2A0C2_MICM2|nr:helicase associated domain-containing protein [Microscilla marina]EAY23914.1 helicase, putative [Microscilla marina ATCC 23134]
MKDKEWTYPFGKPYGWDIRDERWYVRYLELKAYKKTHGDCKVPKAWAPNPALARWVSGQRRKRQQMSDWRKNLLDQIKFTWRINPPLKIPPKSWEQHYQELVAFKNDHGHANVPHSWPANPRLAKWVGAQRGHYKKGELSAHKVKQLEAIGFSWVLQVQIVLPWEDYYQKLQSFKQIHGHCNVPSTFEDQKLAKWVARQRKIVDTISGDRKQLLDNIGFTWRLRKGRLSWEARYEQLLKFRAKYGHCNVVTSDIEEWSGLISWVQEQRRKYKENILSPDQITQLEKVGFVWSALEDVWMKSYEELCLYKEKHGHCFPSLKDPSTKSLGLWVRTQRLMKASLLPHRLELLNEIGFDWQQEAGRAKEKWMVKYKELKEYKNKHGHFIIPQSDRSLKSLRMWFFGQRSRFKQGKLSSSRVELLDKLGVEWREEKHPRLEEGLDLDWGGKSTYIRRQWMGKYRLLKDFKNTHGHFVIPGDKNKPLCDWLFSQRKKFKEGKLAQHFIDLLDDLGREWKVPQRRNTKKKN